MESKNKPFFMLKTKSDLLLAEERKQLFLTPQVREELGKEQFKLDSFVGAKVEKNSPGKVVEVTLVESPEVFLKMML